MNLKSENMPKRFTDKLKDIYKTYKDKKNPPVPVKDIRDFLELSGIPLEEDDTK
jgi:N-acetyl-beta-hexosaminidase